MTPIDADMSWKQLTELRFENVSPASHVGCLEVQLAMFRAEQRRHHVLGILCHHKRDISAFTEIMFDGYGLNRWQTSEVVNIHEIA
jgi:hypothetical protein